MQALNGISARSVANYQLVEAGTDGTFDTADDIVIALGPAYSFPETNLILQASVALIVSGKHVHPNWVPTQAII